MGLNGFKEELFQTQLFKGAVTNLGLLRVQRERARRGYFQETELGVKSGTASLQVGSANKAALGTGETTWLSCKTHIASFGGYM